VTAELHPVRPPTRAGSDPGAPPDRARPGAPPVLVVGLGNPVLGDDGVGWRIVDALERRLAADPSARASVGAVELDRLAVGGFSLMERLVGYDRVVIADAVVGVDTVGTVSSCPLGAVADRLAGPLDSAHDATLDVALAAGRALGARLPDEVTVVGVTARRVDEFDEHLSPPVEAAVGPAVEAVLAALARPRAGAR
jgi:hydrogenase maturation protease